MKDGVFELLDKLEISLNALENGRKLCELIYSEFDFEDISTAKKLDIYDRVNVLIGFLFEKISEVATGFHENFYKLWDLLNGEETKK